MNQKLHSEGIIKDDKGVALTEFVIVIPIVLLLFFAVLQYFDVVRASQLGNYAVYVAARSYAVHGADKNDPQHLKANLMARNAACMALAPIARAVPGELGRPFNFDLASIGLNFLQGLFSDKYAGTYADGYYSAQFIRLLGVKNFKLIPPGSDNPNVVKVEINYPQPIYLPVLKGIWNLVTSGYVSGPQDIVNNLKPLEDGTYVLMHESNPFGPVNTFPYINVKSKCTMGYEEWSGTRQPRFTDSPLGDSNPSNSSSTLGSLMSSMLGSLSGFGSMVGGLF